MSHYLWQVLDFLSNIEWPLLGSNISRTCLLRQFLISFDITACTIANRPSAISENASLEPNNAWLHQKPVFFCNWDYQAKGTHEAATSFQLAQYFPLEGVPLHSPSFSLECLAGWPDTITVSWHQRVLPPSVIVFLVCPLQRQRSKSIAPSLVWVNVAFCTRQP